MVKCDYTLRWWRDGCKRVREGESTLAQVGKEGAQGFYKVWVSDAPIEAELGAADLPRSRLSAAIASMIRDG